MSFACVLQFQSSHGYLETANGMLSLRSAPRVSVQFFSVDFDCSSIKPIRTTFLYIYIRTHINACARVSLRLRHRFDDVRSTENGETLFQSRNERNSSNSREEIYEQLTLQLPTHKISIRDITSKKNRKSL